MAVHEHRLTKYTRMAFFIQASLSLFFCLLFFIFISCKKNLRTTRCNQVFLNILLIHILFNISTVSAEINAPGDFQCIAVHNAYFLALVTGLSILCIERILLVKFPAKHRRINDDFTSAVLIFSWAPCILFLCVELIDEKHHIRHLITFRVVIVSLGEILMLSLSCTIYKLAIKYDTFVKEHTALPQQSERMVSVCSLCISAVVSCSILWLPLLVADMLVLEWMIPVEFVYPIQHFTPLNALVHIFLFVYLSSDFRQELKDFFKGAREYLFTAFWPRAPEILSLESLWFREPNNHSIVNNIDYKFPRTEAYV